MTQFRHARKILAGSMLVMGACGISYEYTIGALGNNLIGSSHEQIFVIIGLMMFAMGIGAVVQKQITKNLIDKFLFIEMLLGIFGGISALVIYVAYAHMASYMLVVWGYALLIGFFIGLEIPLLIRVNKEYSESLKTNLSDILCMDYVGSLIGALLFTYVMLANLSLDRIAIVLGAVNIGVAIIGMFYFRRLLVRQGALHLLAVGALTLLGVCFNQSPSWVASLEQRTFEDPIIHSQTTKYQQLVMTKKNDRVRLYINGHLQFSSKDEEIYHELLVHVPFSVARSRKDVLILGGGDGLALREILKYPEVRSVALVDIDPAITQLASRNKELVELNEGSLLDARVSILTPKGISSSGEQDIIRPTKLKQELFGNKLYKQATVQILNVDADIFIKQIKNKYDVIIIDFPDPSSVGTAKLYSLEFYRALRSRLKPGGVVAVQSTSPFHAKEIFLCIGETLKAAKYRVLPYHQNVPSFGEWGWHLAWVGSDSEQLMKERINNLQSLSVPTKYITTDIIRSSIAFGKGWLDHTNIEVNTKLRPSILRYYRVAWED